MTGYIMTISCKRAAIVPNECQSMGARSGSTSLFLLNSISACSLVSGALSSWIQEYTCSRFPKLELLKLVAFDVTMAFRLAVELAMFVVREELVLPMLYDATRLVPGPDRPMELGAAEAGGGGVEDTGGMFDI